VAFSDADLIARVLLHDDEHAFAELVRRYQSPVRGFLLKMTNGDAHLAGAGRKAWATKRDSWLAASSLYGNPTDLDRQKLAGAFADTVCALTRGQYGYGHSRAYLRQGNRAFMEAYANAFSMVQAKDPIYASHFPSLTKFIQQQFSTP
jgi:hypothetical protein